MLLAIRQQVPDNAWQQWQMMPGLGDDAVEGYGALAQGTALETPARSA